MRLANCKIVCREIEEAEHGENHSASVAEHLTRCGQCQRFYDERLKLRQLVASLDTVEAPADFAVRVRSRIANERSGPPSGFLFSDFNFGFPSVALVTLALVVGGVFALRIWNAPSANITAVQTDTPESTKSEIAGELPSAESGLRSNADKSVSTATNEPVEKIRQDPKTRKRSPLRNVVASSRKGKGLATMEFSSTAAPVVRQEEAVASVETFPIFSIDTSPQPLRLSLDYSGGISRTISVPSLSFGSERVLSADGLSSIKNSSKGAW